MKTFLVTEDTDLKTFTDSVYPQGSFCLPALLRAGDVKINGVRTRSNANLKRGDEVVFFTTKKQESKPSHSVVYEDDNILIADKADGVSSEGLLYELSEKGEFYAVHRLDRNTCGLIIFAKTKAAEEELLSAFKERKISKIYFALCKNAFKKSEDVCTAYLKKDPKSGFVKISDKDQGGAEKIATEYRVEREQGDIALVKVRLHTGKTHQIRAHMAYLGCPVLGDEKYGDSALNDKYGARRQRLIAKYLSFYLKGDLSYLNGKTFESAFEFDNMFHTR